MQLLNQGKSPANLYVCWFLIC